MHSPSKNVENVYAKHCLNGQFPTLSNTDNVSIPYVLLDDIFIS